MFLYYYISAAGGAKRRVKVGSGKSTNTLCLALGCPTPLHSEKPEEEFVYTRISLCQSTEISACTSGNLQIPHPNPDTFGGVISMALVFHEEKMQ